MAVMGMKMAMAAPTTEPISEADDDPLPGDDVVAQQRADDGHQHADLGIDDAAPRRGRRAEPLQPEDEQHRGRQVGDLQEDS